MYNKIERQNFPDIFDIKISCPASNFFIPETQQLICDQRDNYGGQSEPEPRHNIQDQRTQDQMMNTLSFSIQDLLSKISKVREQHEVPSSKKAPSHHQQPLPSKTSNISFSTQNNSNRSRSDKYIQKYQPEQWSNKKGTFQPQMEVFSKSQRNVQIFLPQSSRYELKSFATSQPNRQVKNEVRKQIKTLLCPFGTSAFGNADQALRSKPKRSIVVQDYLSQSQPGYRQVPISDQKRVKSLFDGKNIRQVAASTIFQSLQTNKGVDISTKTYNPFETIVGQKGLIAESKIITTNQPFFETPIIRINGIQMGGVVQQGPSLTIQDFELGRQLGSGKFGDVYQAVHKMTGALYAIKKIFKSTILEYQMVEQFARQLKIHYSLDYPNIIKLYTHFDDVYHIFLVMEFGQGGMLMERLKSGQQFGSMIIEQMLRSVEYLHNKKIAHRDIKPQNIVMMFNDTAKLCDFGWSRVFDSDMKKTFCGTLDYVSPQMKDKGQYSLKIDIWSLGVLTFQIICGFAPFKNQITHWKNKGSNLNQTWNWNILYPPDISSVSESFMRNLLKQNPNERANIRFCLNHLFIRKYNMLNYDEEQDKRFRQISMTLRDEQ